MEKNTHGATKMTGDIAIKRQCSPYEIVLIFLSTYSYLKTNIIADLY